jgi:hypothetical protein
MVVIAADTSGPAQMPALRFETAPVCPRKKPGAKASYLKTLSEGRARHSATACIKDAEDILSS